jgi:xylulokinase
MSGSRALLLGLDVGTTATKALLLDMDGAVVAASSRPYDLLTPQPGWVEQDPEALWQAVVEAIRAVLETTGAGDRVVALSQASQGGTTIPVDRDGDPVYPAISWMDERGAETVGAIHARLGDDVVRIKTGWPLGHALSLNHLVWLRRQRPEIFERAAHFSFVNDFVTRRLTGAGRMNPSDATMTQLFNVATGDWDALLLDVAGIAADVLSPVAASGTPIGALTPEAVRATGLPEDLLVVNGAHDQYCAAVATGVTRPGAVLLSCGTAWVVLAVPEGLEVGLKSGLAISCHAVPGRWGGIRSLGGVGASLEWFLREVWSRTPGTEPSAARYAALNAAVAQVPPGAHGLLFYPLAGGHARIGAGRGGFARLALEHTRADMARAVMEGVAYELRWALDEITDQGLDMASLKMVGGGAESPIWPQIVADVTGLPVALPALRQAAALGAAMLAGVGAGLFPDAEAAYAAFERPGRLVAPDPALRARYERHFILYRQTYPEA